MLKFNNLNMEEPFLSQLLRVHKTNAKKINNMKRKKSKSKLAKNYSSSQEVTTSNEVKKDNIQNICCTKKESIKLEKVPEYIYFCDPNGKIHKDMLQYINIKNKKIN